jgi:hypothetical protein
MTSNTLQNRVDPWGDMHAIPSRGTLMGNRGILHDAENKIVRPWAHRAWVTCLLEFNGIKRPKPFSPGNYSELFFIDEATAFAAGHRPCAYCQRARHREFKDAWVRANVAVDFRAATLIPDVDKRLHAERTVASGGKARFDAPLFELPPGAIFEYGGTAYLVSAAGYLPWSFNGYGAPKTIHPAQSVRVMTPRSIILAFAAGFAPNVHPSASQLSVPR